MSRRLRSFWIALALPLAAAIGACNEDLQTGDTCPVLCPGQEVEIRDTIIEGIITLDSSLIGFPFQGSEDPLLLAHRQDTLDVRVVVRFDTLQRLYTRTDGDTPEQITALDSAYVAIFIGASELPTPAQWFIDVYNVWDSTVVDTLPEQLLPGFVPGNLIGTYQGDTAFTDTLRLNIPIDTTYLRTLLSTDNARLHLGFRVRSAASVQFRFNSSDAGAGPRLHYKIISTDTLLAANRTIVPASLTPAQPAALAGDLVDFQVVALAPAEETAGTFIVGGLPGSRAYLRFDLPVWLTDSVGVLRTELELTQDPIAGMSSTDTLQLDGHLIVAKQTVPDLFRAATLLTGAGLFMPSKKVVPSDSGTFRININNLVSQWNTNNTARALPTAIILRSALEGGTPGVMRFFSTEAVDPALRPRLRVSYTPGSIFGRP